MGRLKGEEEDEARSKETDDVGDEGTGRRCSVKAPNLRNVRGHRRVQTRGDRRSPAEGGTKGADPLRDTSVQEEERQPKPGGISGGNVDGSAIERPTTGGAEEA